MSASMAKAPRMTLDHLLAGLLGEIEIPALPVAGLCHDSRALMPGDLFCALAGSRSHGMRHAAEAVAAGAIAILYDPAQGGRELAAVCDTVPCWPVEFLDQRLGYLADRFFGEPSRHLEVLAITGTNGKTSSSHFVAHALKGAGKNAAVIGTLGWGEPGSLTATRHTTPDAIEMHALLARLRGEGVAAVAVEASSHGLSQGRLNGVHFKGGLFTNLSRDHLDYHGTMGAYLDAKLRLVEWPGLEFLAFNLDDASAAAIRARTPGSVRKIGFSTGRPAGSCVDIDVLKADDVVQDQAGLRFLVTFQGETAPVVAPVYGEFNVDNLLGALAVLLGLNMPLEEAARHMGKVHAVPGRMERFFVEGGPLVVVDYAHTPDALAKALTSLRRHCAGRLGLVFGCGGDRDRGKRPQMGAIACQMADFVIVTDDNPRHEDGDAIVREILGGCPPGGDVEVSVLRDRRLAIQTAIEIAGPADVVLVAGKGHEDYQEVAGVRYPFSDRVAVPELLAARGGALCA